MASAAGFAPTVARRTAESATLLVDAVVTGAPMRQWMLSCPSPPRFLLTSRVAIVGKMLINGYRALAMNLIKKKQGIQERPLRPVAAP